MNIPTTKTPLRERHVRVLQEIRDDLRYLTRFAGKVAALDFAIDALSDAAQPEGGDAVKRDIAETVVFWLVSRGHVSQEVVDATFMEACHHAANRKDWPGEQFWRDRYAALTRPVAAQQAVTDSLAGYVAGYLPKRQAIEIKADAPLPAWLTSQYGVRVTVTSAQPPESQEGQ